MFEPSTANTDSVEVSEDYCNSAKRGNNMKLKLDKINIDAIR